LASGHVGMTLLLKSGAASALFSLRGLACIMRALVSTFIVKALLQRLKI